MALTQRQRKIAFRIGGMITFAAIGLFVAGVVYVVWVTLATVLVWD